MKTFMKKGFIQKLALVLIVITIFSILMPNVVKAGAIDEVGGALLKPVVTLVLKLFDGIVDLIHKVIFGMETALLEYNIKSSSIIFVIIGAIVAGILVAIFASWAIPALGEYLLSMGIAAEALKSFALAGAIKVGVSTALIAGVVGYTVQYGDVVPFPIYKISPEEIFANKIDVLNVNFFSDSSSNTSQNSGGKKVSTQIGQIPINDITDANEVMRYTNTINSKIKEATGIDVGLTNLLPNEKRQTLYTGKNSNGEEISIEAKSEKSGNSYVTTLTQRREIKEGQSNEAIIVEEEGKAANIGMQLKPVVSKWYHTLRNIAIVLMLLELVYVGIRILMTSVASDKAKYKNMLVDWTVAICLLFVMHYIMAFANNINDAFINIVTNVGKEQKYAEYIIDEDNIIADRLENEEQLKDVDLTEVIQDNPYGNGKVINWNAGNLMGLARCEAAKQGDVPGVGYIGYTIAFMVLVMYTVFFLFTYIKRVIYMAFLTMIAPLVAFTYAIDKMNDGHAQAFNMWFKEYIFNLLLQPFHLILYTVLISSAFQLASENILYTLVAIGFLLPAEKLLRKFFGFEKAQTPGLLGGAAGAALVMSGMNRLFSHKGQKIGGGEGQEGKIKENENIRGLAESTDDTLAFGKDGEEEIEKPVASNIDSQEELTNANKNGQPKTQNYEIFAGYAKEPNVTPKVDEKSTPKPNEKPKAKLQASERRWSRLRGIRGAAKSYAGQQFRRAGNAAIKGIRDLPKTTAGLAGGVAAGMIGVAAGIAAEDPAKILQYGAAGAAGGYIMGTGASNTANNIVSVDERQMQVEIDRERATRDYVDENGKVVETRVDEEEYKRLRRHRHTDRQINNNDNVKVLQETLGMNRREARNLLERSRDVFDAGLDIEDVMAVREFEEKGISREEAISTANLYKKAEKAPGKMGDKEKFSWDFKARNIIRKNGVDESKVEPTLSRLNKKLDDYGGTINKYK